MEAGGTQPKVPLLDLCRQQLGLSEPIHLLSVFYWMQGELTSRSQRTREKATEEQNRLLRITTHVNSDT